MFQAENVRSRIWRKRPLSLADRHRTRTDAASKGHTVRPSGKELDDPRCSITCMLDFNLERADRSTAHRHDSPTLRLFDELGLSMCNSMVSTGQRYVPAIAYFRHHATAERSQKRRQQLRLPGSPIICRELHYRHVFRRAAASLISASSPQYEKRRKRLPRAWSKSTPGVTAIPASASTRAQKAALSFDRSVISANR